MYHSYAMSNRNFVLPRVFILRFTLTVRGIKHGFLPFTARNRMFTKVAFGSADVEIYTKMVLISLNFQCEPP
jgi:hypothetical protein